MSRSRSPVSTMPAKVLGRPWNYEEDPKGTLGLVAHRRGVSGLGGAESLPRRQGG